MKKIVTLIIGTLLVFLMSGCSNSSTSNAKIRSSSHNGSPSISFATDKQQIWFVLSADDFDKNGKNVIPDQMIITKNGKATVYNTGYDYSAPKYYKHYLRIRKKVHIPTIGDYSKMSDKQIISQAATIDKNSYNLMKAYFTDRNLDPALSFHYTFYAYSRPVSHSMKITLYTDRTGNKTITEKITLSNAARKQISYDKTQHSSNLSYKFTHLVNKPATIYQSHYYGYFFSDSTTSDSSASAENEYYLTRSSKTPKVTFDSLKTPGAVLH
ncbi:hypothetical protein ACT543_03905 [Lactiplantibacillus plantarum]|uniref:hypothetical protein n=1 Tax=Lactiplantibacillus plantarum TaxID=1590 RepID=UPI004035777C